MERVLNFISWLWLQIFRQAEEEMDKREKPRIWSGEDYTSDPEEDKNIHCSRLAGEFVENENVEIR